MALRLTTDEEKRLQIVSATMLSPLDYDEPEGWCEAVTRGAKELLGADSGGVTLPIEGRHRLWADKIDAARQYYDRAPILDRQLGFVGRAVALGSYDRLTLFRPFLDNYLEGSFYNEFILPNRMLDGIGLAVSPTAGTSLDEVGQLLLHHEDTRRPFGDRGPAILRLLLPSFRAGATAWLRFAGQRGTLLAALDQLEEPLLLCDSAGMVLHANVPLQELFGTDPEGETLRSALEQIAKTFTRASTRDSVANATCGRVERKLNTRSHHYRAYCSYAGEGVLLRGPVIIVGVQRLTTSLPTEAAIAERFGLTRAQARVALLLARGKSNREIADELVISPATARNHTARVREKLGVPSRAKVATAILTGSGI